MKAPRIVATICIVLACIISVWGVHYQLSHPELTHTQLLLDTWMQWLSMVVLAATGLFCIEKKEPK